MAQTQPWAGDPLFEDPQGFIERFSWGLFTIHGAPHGETEAGRVGAGKDVRVIGDAVTRWRERIGHELSEEMITGVYGLGIETLVIGVGVYGLIQCPAPVQAAIHAAGIRVLILEPTPQACATYNALVRQGATGATPPSVALLAHGTC
jgi:hypothetical protein